MLQLAMLRLVLANLNYSSWSMRAWLGLQKSGLPFRTFDVGMFEKPDWRDSVRSFSGAGKVPILVDGASSIHESLAILETVAEKAPETRLWPEDPALRARGRAISMEMATGFLHLRNEMPCNIRARAKNKPQSEGLVSDIRRVLEILGASLSTSSGKYLLGEFSIADCMYFPVLTRFRTYGVRLPADAALYSEAMFALPEVQELEKIAQESSAIDMYDAKLH